MCVADPVVKQVALMHYYHEKFHMRLYKSTLMDDKSTHHVYRLRLPSTKQVKSEPLDLNIVDFANRDPNFSCLFRE
jgi:hypothetical protein